MNSSFLYHVWGLYHHKCLREEYKGNTIILHIESKRYPKYCPQCGHAHLVKNGFRILDFISLPISGKKVIRCIKVRRYKCKCADCDYDCQERISFVLDGHSYTRRFVRFEAVSNLEVDRTTAVLKSFCCAESRQLGDEAAPRQGFDGQKAAEHQPKIEHERQDERAPTGLAKFVDCGFAA